MTTLILVTIPPANGKAQATELDFTIGPNYSCPVTAGRIQFDSEQNPTIREIVSKAWSKEYSLTAYVEVTLDCLVQFQLHLPYDMAVIVSEKETVIGKPYTGSISVIPKETYFRVATSINIKVKIGSEVKRDVAGAKISIPGAKIDKEFALSINPEPLDITTGMLSPLGTYRIPVGEKVKPMIVVLMPQLQVTGGLGAVGGSVTVPFDWDMDLVITSQLNASPTLDQSFTTSPSTIQITGIAPVDFTYTPKIAGEKMLSFSFTNTLSAQLEVFGKSKVKLEGELLGAGGAIESPSYSLKLYSSPLVQSKITKENAVSEVVAIRSPKLSIDLLSVDMGLTSSHFTFKLKDEFENSIMGATVLANGKVANEVGEGQYTANIESSQITSNFKILVYATKKDYQNLTKDILISDRYLNEVKAIQKSLTELQSSYSMLENRVRELESQPSKTITQTITIGGTITKTETIAQTAISPQALTLMIIEGGVIVFLLLLRKKS